MTSTISVGVLETGVPPTSLVARHGRYDAMMRRMLGEEFHFSTYDVQAGDLPTEPEAHAAYIITGSAAGIYDPLPWIAPLQNFVRAAHGRAKLVGICFGHQVIAAALGGRVEKSHKGWGLGLHVYDVTGAAPWPEPGIASVAVAASHQDQVVALPPGATVLAASAFTPYAALAYAGGGAVSVQFHPEFSHEFATDLIKVRRPYLPADDVDLALASLRSPGDAPRIGGWIRRFIGGT